MAKCKCRSLAGFRMVCGLCQFIEDFDYYISRLNRVVYEGLSPTLNDLIMMDAYERNLEELV